MRRLRRRHKQLLEDLKVKRKCWNRKEEALDRSRWRTGFEKAVDLAEDNSIFYICDSVHHQFILLNSQLDAALRSRIYYSLRDYSICFGCFLRPSSGVH
jgi:hypothetical protein